MRLDQILSLQLRRVNAFQGLVIDADTWQDAHNYHNNQHKLHLLAFHNTGIVEGLNVVHNSPPDLSVNIEPGLAIDPDANTVLVTQAQHYQIQTQQKGTIYLTIQFREIPAEPYQPPEGGQATRILEAYRIQEGDKLPNEAYIELARINFDPAKEVISDAKTPSRPGTNEINLNFREDSKKVTPEPSAPPSPPVASVPSVAPENAAPPVAVPPSPPQEKIALGHAVLGGADQNLHIVGLNNMVRDVNQRTHFVTDLAENISLDKDINHYTMVYLTGSSSFELTDQQQAALSDFLQSGGVIFGEGCPQGAGEEQSKGMKEFGLAFNQLANKLDCKLETVQRGDTLLSAANIFSTAPPGAESSNMLLQGGNMIYSGSDYGCAWQGGRQDNLLSRDVIRASFEIGVNIISYAHMVKTAAH
ncbi:DUF4159 domain-containing protein [Chloroflexota bacterium]